MKPAPFRYHAPSTVDEVVGLLHEHADSAKVLAGGQSLVPMLALRLTRFDHLVDINGVESLNEVAFSPDDVRIGAVARQRILERNEQIRATAPLLAAAAPHIGHFQIRNRGTVCGSLAHADPASELPAVAVALDASFETNRRTIPADSFFVDTWTTALDDDELLTAVTFPRWTGSTRVAVYEVARRSGDFALAGAVVQIAVDDDTVTRAAIGLFGLGSTPLRAREAEAALVAGAEPGEVAEIAMRDTDPSHDIRATANQRRRMGAAAVRRAVNQVQDGSNDDG